MVKIVVDSGCDLTPELRTQTGAETVPLNLQIGNNFYTDDEHLDLDAYMRDMDASKETPRTAAPSPEIYMERYRGDESVFVVTISSKLSASYNSAMLARDLYMEEIGSKFIHVFDSLSASIGETLTAMKIAEFAERKFSNAEIVEHVSKFISSMKTYFIIDKFDTLVKNGRMKASVATLASILSIKPICAGVNGSIEILDKARGYKKAVQRLIEIMQKEGVDFENKVLAISHAKCLDKALALKDEVLKKIKFKDVVVCDMKGLCTTYANKGGIILSF